MPSYMELVYKYFLLDKDIKYLLGAFYSRDNDIFKEWIYPVLRDKMGIT